MLNPERAKEALREFQVADVEACRAEAARQLPAALRPVAYGLLGRDDDGNAVSSRKWEEMQKLIARAHGRLETLNAQDRTEVFATLFPKLAPHVEQAWQLHRRLPFQCGYSRKAFRAPELPSQTRAARTAWLDSLLHIAKPYEQDVAWFAAWAPYIGGYHGDALGVLLAAAIDAGGPEGDKVFDILLASARGEHEIGAMGRHVTRALLVASRPDGWEYVEKLLLAAQRQEGLRQSVLEAIDEAHPEAFRRMLRLIRENDLTRFSATIRAIDTWFGFGYEALNAKQAQAALGRAEKYLEDAQARADALALGDGQAVYLALWAAAFEDAPAALALATPLLADADPERRFVAVFLLSQLGLRRAKEAIAPALDDPDLRIAWTAFPADARGQAREEEETHDGEFERLERLLARIPAKLAAPLEPIVWPWMALMPSRETVADTLPTRLGKSPLTRVLPYLPAMSAGGRALVADKLGKDKSGDPEIKAALLKLIGDPATWVRDQALKAVEQQKITAQEAPHLEGLLTRKTGDLRRGVLGLLLAQPDIEALASAERLLGAKDKLQRQAGLETLAQMVKAKRAPSDCRRAAADYRASAAKRTEAEEKLLDTLLDVKRKEPTLDDGLGLFDPKQCSPRVPPTAPNPRKFLGIALKPEPLVTPAAVACLKALDELIHAHREESIKPEYGEEQLLGSIQWGFPNPNPQTPLADDLARLPLRDVWEGWWRNRPAALRDADGLELLRALAPFMAEGCSYYSAPEEDKGTPWLRDARAVLFGGHVIGSLKYRDLVSQLLSWLLRLDAPQGAADFLLDAVETTFTLVPDHHRWRDNARFLGWLVLARRHRGQCPDDWTTAQGVRLWRLLHWMDQPKPEALRMRPALDDLLAAYGAEGGPNEADLLDQLIGPRPKREGYGSAGFDELRTLSGRRPSPLFEKHPGLRELVDRCRERIVEVELGRGELATAASAPAMALRSLMGVGTLVPLLQALGADGFTRGHSYGWYNAENASKAGVFSHLARVTFPAPADTKDGFAERVKAAKIGAKRLVELAVYAPQWAPFVEHALGWPELAEGVWWIHAHTKDAQWSVDQEVREVWTAEASERTPLSAQSLLDGAVDVAWFHRVYSALGPERWKELDAAAKYASGGGGHKRAQLFADAMLGRLGKSELVARITAKRNGDAARALGLVPLANGARRETDVLDRYQTLQEFVRGSRQFGAQRQASEKMAAQIGLENLARTAGYPDPVRLEWAMEAQSVSDLADGPVTVTAGDVSVSLAINEWGEPNITVAKNGRALKAIPPAVKKAEEVASLVARKTEIQRQASRMRLSLEAAMCRGDAFSGAELRKLLRHPVLAPMLRSLALVGDDGLAGYPAEGGAALEGLDSVSQSLPDTALLRIAHPHDLLQTGRWHAWQRDCFLRERIQPFKQVFREVYVLTEAEQADKTQSQRYAGHQVNHAQALALLGKRGWVGHPNEGDVRRTFHAEGLTVSLAFDYGYTTPAEVEGLTIDQVAFTRRGDWKPLELAQIPPRVFSEAMRDLDLVVSVAHQGGVDPEASASTVEMRAVLVREACALLKIGNVRLQTAHALIDGHLGTYSVHLGSAIVHRQPGGHLCIVPVHGQHRGRLFLPFLDDDPRTAEVVSKVILLSRDKEIKDPIILEQIYAGAV